MLGVPGLMRAYRAGNVALANAVGTGVADDKAVYAYMPRVIRYYLGQDPILPNVETHICREPDALRYTLDHLEELVVKPVGEAGGYGITIGPQASRAGTRGLPGQAGGRPGQLHQPALHQPVGRADAGRWRRSSRATSICALCDHRGRDLGAPGRAHAGGAAQRLAGGQLVAGRRIEGYVGP